MKRTSAKPSPVSLALSMGALTVALYVIVSGLWWLFGMPVGGTFARLVAAAALGAGAAAATRTQVGARLVFFLVLVLALWSLWGGLFTAAAVFLYCGVQRWVTPDPATPRHLGRAEGSRNWWADRMGREG